MRAVIIGYGNPLRGDDSLGWKAAERLGDLLRPSEAEVLAVHQLTPELMETLSRVDRAIFIDASAEGKPGEVAERSLKPRPDADSFTHNCSPAGLLAGARDLYRHAPEAILLTVAGEDFSFSSELSPTVASRFDEVISRALAALRRSQA
jgi:hydrogenase maturation protease